MTKAVDRSLAREAVEVGSSGLPSSSKYSWKDCTRIQLGSRVERLMTYPLQSIRGNVDHGLRLIVVDAFVSQHINQPAHDGIVCRSVPAIVSQRNWRMVDIEDAAPDGTDHDRSELEEEEVLRRLVLFLVWRSSASQVYEEANVPAASSSPGSRRDSAYASRAASKAPPSLCCFSSGMLIEQAFAAGASDRVEKSIWTLM